MIYIPIFLRAKWYKAVKGQKDYAFGSIGVKASPIWLGLFFVAGQIFIMAVKKMMHLETSLGA